MFSTPPKRIAYVGLSSPIFYDYSREGTRLDSEINSSPNPVLDGPFGLFLLFDEIWFLTRALCPWNLRQAAFVRFLDEEKRLPGSLQQIQQMIEERREGIIERFFSKVQLEKQEKWATNYRRTVCEVGVSWPEARPDNHTHGLKIGDGCFRGNSARLENVIFDMVMVRSLAPDRPELVTNTFTNLLFQNDSHALREQQFAQSIVINDITSFVGPEGPYHSCIDEVREIHELIDFRKWIATQPKHVAPDEAFARGEEIRRRIEEEKDRVFLKYLSPGSQVKNYALTMLGIGVDAVLGGGGPLIDLGSQLQHCRDVRDQQWQAFILKSDRIIQP